MTDTTELDFDVSPHRSGAIARHAVRPGQWSPKSKVGGPMAPWALVKLPMRGLEVRWEGPTVFAIFAVRRLIPDGGVITAAGPFLEPRDAERWLIRQMQLAGRSEVEIAEDV